MFNSPFSIYNRHYCIKIKHYFSYIASNNKENTYFLDEHATPDNRKILLPSLAVASDWIIAAFLSRLLQSLSASFLQVLLVVLFCSVEPPRREDLSHDFVIF